VNRISLFNTLRLAIYACVAAAFGLYLYAAWLHPQPPPEDTNETTIIVEGVIESVTGKTLDSLIGRNPNDGRLSLLLDLFTADTCHVQFRVENQLIQTEPKYSFCQKAEKGDKVRIRKVISLRSGGEIHPSYKLIEH
jgi:hypothetical protein